MSDTDDDRDQPSPADESLLADLGDALGPDPVPVGLHERALALLSFADVDSELTLLLAESDADLAGAGVRGDAAVSSLVYSSADGAETIELEVDGGVVTGLLSGTDARTATLERVDGRSLDAAVGPLGGFRWSDVAPGPARIRVVGSSGTVCTEWFVI